MEEAALVYYDSRKAGVLKKNEGRFEFQYDPNYLADPGARPVSFSLPLQSEKFISPTLFSFFDGLLPEGWLLEMTCAAAHIDPNDKFHLLLHTGRDPIGAVCVKPVDPSHG